MNAKIDSINIEKERYIDICNNKDNIIDDLKIEVNKKIGDMNKLQDVMKYKNDEISDLTKDKDDLYNIIERLKNEREK